MAGAATQPLSRSATMAGAATQPLSRSARVAEWLSGLGENFRHCALNERSALNGPSAKGMRAPNRGEGGQRGQEGAGMTANSKQCCST